MERDDTRKPGLCGKRGGNWDYAATGGYKSHPSERAIQWKKRGGGYEKKEWRCNDTFFSLPPLFVNLVCLLFPPPDGFCQVGRESQAALLVLPSTLANKGGQFNVSNGTSTVLSSRSHQQLRVRLKVEGWDY